MTKTLFTSTFTFEGKRYYVRSSKSQKDADQKAAVRKREMEESRVIINPSTTVKQYAELWLSTYKEGSVEKETYQAYKYAVTNRIVPAVGKLKLSEVRPINLQTIINTEKGRSKNFYTKLRYTIQQIFTQAKKDRLLRENPAEDLEIPKAKDGTNRSITKEERRAILAAAETHHFGLFVQVMLWTGLRPQEVAALRCEDINEIGKTLQVRRALKATGDIGETKSRAGMRIVPIPPQLWCRIAPLLPRGGYLVKPMRSVHYTRSSLSCASASFWRAVDIELGAVLEDGAIIKSAIADDLTLYCLRHTYCTDLQAAGIPINVAKDFMGHSSIALTAKIYTHMRDDILEDAAKKIADFGATVGATVDTQNEHKVAIIIDSSRSKNKSIKTS